MQSEITWSTDEHGALIGARVHDGHLSELEIADNRPTRIVITRASGGRVEFKLHGMSRFGLMGFCNGSIVSDVLAWSLTAAPDDAWAMSDNPWRILFSNDLDDADLIAESRKLRASRSTDTLLQITFSYGGAMAFLCERLSVFDLEEK